MPEHVPPTDDELKQWADWLSDENFIVTPSRLNLLRLIAEVRRLNQELAGSCRMLPPQIRPEFHCEDDND